MSTRTIRYISHQRIENKSPSQRICERLLDLIHLEMLVTNSLLVLANSLNSKNSILFTQKPRIHLVIRHQPQEEDAHGGSEQSGEEEDDFPRSNGASALFGPFGNSIGNQATEYLRKTIEGEPYVHAETLLTLGVPLRSKESKAGRNSCLEDSEEEPHRNGTGEVLDRSEKTQSDTPHDDVECRVFAKRKSLEKSVYQL